MQRLEVSGAVRLIYGSLGVKRLRRRVVTLAVITTKFDACADTSCKRAAIPPLYGKPLTYVNMAGQSALCRFNS